MWGPAANTASLMQTLYKEVVNAASLQCELWHGMNSTEVRACHTVNW